MELHSNFVQLLIIKGTKVIPHTKSKARSNKHDLLEEEIFCSLLDWVKMHCVAISVKEMESYSVFLSCSSWLVSMAQGK